jgi:hypothetical protein
MMPATRLWLPPASQVAAEAAVSTVVDAWASEWLTTDQKVGVRRGKSADVARMSWGGSRDAMLGLNDGTAAKIGRAICAGRGNEVNPRDRTVLARVGEEALDHFAEQFEIAARAPTKLDPHHFSGRVHSVFIIGPADRTWSLGLVLGDDNLNLLRLRKAGGHRVPRLGTFKEALASEPCRIGVSLGQTALNAFELATLERGDVIRLDTPQSAALPLIVEGRRVGPGSAKIESAPDGYSVQVVTPFSIHDSETHLV